MAGRQRRGGELSDDRTTTQPAARPGVTPSGLPLVPTAPPPPGSAPAPGPAAAPAPEPAPALAPEPAAAPVPVPVVEAPAVVSAPRPPVDRVEVPATVPAPAVMPDAPTVAPTDARTGTGTGVASGATAAGPAAPLPVAGTDGPAVRSARPPRRRRRVEAQAVTVRPSTADGSPLGAGSGRSDWRRVPGRRGLGPVPLVALVGVELLVLGVVLARSVPTTAALVGGVIVALVGLSLLVPSQGASLGGRALRQVRHLLGSRVVRAGEPGAGTGPSSLALFPELSVQQVRTPRGEVFGVARRAGAATAVLSLAPPAAQPAGARGATVPLDAVRARLVAAGIQPETVAVVEQRDAGSTTARVVAVRLRPARAEAAVEARGGGERGILACLSTAVATTAAVLAEHGLDAHPLDRDALTGLLAAQADPQPDSPVAAVWHGAWAAVVGPNLAHRVLAATTVAGGADLAGLWVPVAHQWVALEADGTATDDGGVPVRLLVRLADSSPTALDTAVATLRSVPGVTLAPVVEDTLDAVRATTALGSGLARPDRAAAAAAGPLEGRLLAPPADLGRVL